MNRKRRVFFSVCIGLSALALAIGWAAWPGRQAVASADVVLRGQDLFLLDTAVGEQQLTTSGKVSVLFDQQADRVLYGVTVEPAPEATEWTPRFALHVVRLDGTDDHAVSDQPVTWALLDRSAENVYFTTLPADLFVAPVDGGSPRRLQSKAQQPLLSPDGRNLAYRKLAADWAPGLDYEGSAGLAVYDLSIGQERMVTSVSGDYGPVWTPDGRRLVFYSVSPEGMTSMFVTRLDGQGRRQLTNRGQKFVTAATVPVPSERPTWSPDGKRMAYESDRQVWVTEFSGDDAVRSWPVAYGKRPQWNHDGRSLRVLVGKGGDFDAAHSVTVGLDGKVIRK